MSTPLRKRSNLSLRKDSSGEKRSRSIDSIDDNQDKYQEQNIAKDQDGDLKHTQIEHERQSVKKNRENLAQILLCNDEDSWEDDFSLFGSQFNKPAEHSAKNLQVNNTPCSSPILVSCKSKIMHGLSNTPSPNIKDNTSSRGNTPVEICSSTQNNVQEPSISNLMQETNILSPIFRSSSNISQINKVVRTPEFAFNVPESNLDLSMIKTQWGVVNPSGFVRNNMPVKDTISGRMMDNFKINFFSQEFLRPQQQPSKSQYQEIAMCEAALAKDIDSQFDCTTFYGLPLIVKDLLKKHQGIEELYDWQKECLNLKAIQTRKNLIYSLPTSGGKTLVAEILIWREVLCNEKNVILVLPYVSIVQEKMRTMNEFALNLNFNLEEYSGSKGVFPPKKCRRKHCVYIATIEKAHSLINSFLETKRVGELGLVVVDELHMIGETGGRGCTLENLLTKLRHASQNTMIIGMSATLGDLGDLKKFLDADIYCRNFRPVQLKEYLKVGKEIYSVNPESKSDEEHIQKSRICDFENYTAEMLKQDPDCVAGLVMEVVPQNSCLVFCPTKKNCESVSKLICKLMPQTFKDGKVKEKQDLLEALRDEGSGNICPILERTIPYGVAYHHSGLTLGERQLLEKAYVAGTLSCLCCTSTLAAGVNLPAKRVILRSSYIASQFITHGQMKQMTGRAGRAGIDTTGESIIIVKPGDQRRIGALLREKMEDCNSQLLVERGKGLKILLLSAIGLQIINNETDAFALISKTLLHVQRQTKLKNTDLKKDIVDALQDLKDGGLLRFLPANDQNPTTEVKCILEVSKLGQATFKGAVDLDLAKFLYTDLDTGLKSLVLNSHLHLLYLITPYDMAEQINPIPNTYSKAYMELAAEDIAVAKHVGITEACIMSILVGKKPAHVSERVVRRFYSTLILYSLWKQESIWQVAEKFQLPRGHIQNLLTSSASFATSILYFCKELTEFWAYQELLVNFIKQLSHCVNVELIPLMELPNIKKGRARLLYNAGYTNVQLIAQATPEDLVAKVEHMPRKVAKEIIETAKINIIKQAEEFQEEVEALVTLINE